MHGRDHLPTGADPIPGLCTDCVPGTTNPLDQLILTDPCLVAFWKLNETAGDIAADSGPDGYDLASGPLDPPTWGQPSGPPGEQSAGFAAGDGLSTSSIPALSGDLTVEIWYSRNDNAGGQLISQGNPATNSPGWQLYAQNAAEGSTLRPQLIVGRSSGIISYIEADNTTVIGTWYHVVATRESSEWKMYVDGVQQATTITPTYNTATGLYIGDDTGGGAINGSLSYAAIYNCALTAEQIDAHYTAAGAVSEEGWVLTVDEDGNPVWAPPPEGATFDPATATSWWMPLADSDGTLVLDGDGSLIPTLIPL